MNEKQFLKQMSVLTDVTRLKILYILSLNNFCAIHLEKLLNVSQPNISRHVDKMINADIVLSQKKGRRNIYQLNEEFVNNNSQIIDQIQTIYSDLLEKELFDEYAVECKKLK